MKKATDNLKMAKFLLKIAKDAYKRALKLKIDVSDKKAHDLVTSYDFFIEKQLTSALNKAFPNVKIVSEEYNSGVENKGTYFTIDPIDGTINFANGLNEWAIQIGYVENDEIKASAIYSPVVGEYIAAKGCGAFKNGKQFFTKKNDLTHSLFVAECKYNDRDAITRALLDFTMGVRHIYSTGIDYAFTAEGKYGIFIHSIGHPWDWVPGQLLATEAGCVMKDYKKYHIVATSETILKKVINLLKKAAI